MLLKYLGDWNSVSDIPGITVKHENSDVLRRALARSTNEEGAQHLPVRSRNPKIFVICNIEVVWSRHTFLCPGSYGYVAWVYKLTEIRISSSIIPCSLTYFCLKYRSPLASAAIAEDAKTGSLR